MIRMTRLMVMMVTILMVMIIDHDVIEKSNILLEQKKQKQVVQA